MMYIQKLYLEVETKHEMLLYQMFLEESVPLLYSLEHRGSARFNFKSDNVLATYIHNFSNTN